MQNKPVEFSEGLRMVLQKYCGYRGWQTVSGKTAEDCRLLINRAGSVEDAIEGLQWFFSGKYVDDWIEQERPNLGLPFLISAFERFEIYRSEFRPRRNYFSSAGLNEYAVMRGVI